MKLRSPIQLFYMNNGTTCQLTQLFGENKNQLFYGPKGHEGVDFKTQGTWKWIRDGKEFKRVARDADEKEGYIPIVAAHGGYLTTNFYYRAKQLGWGMFITYQEDHIEYRTLYWHIEKPWRKLGLAWKSVVSMFKPETVKPGAIIAICGNSGYPRYSTGPHLHFELQKRERYNGQWSSWEPIDPMPYFTQHDVVFQRGNQFYYKGKEVTALKAKEILKTI